MKCLQNRLAESLVNLSRLFQALGATTVVVLMTFAVPMPCAIAQGPPQYELTWLDQVHIADWGPNWNPAELPRDINEAGVVVGRADGPFVYEHATRRMQDLNELAGAVWLDLETGNTTNEWLAGNSPMGINECGQIVGRAGHIPGVEDSRHFILNEPLGPAPVFELLPTLNGSGTGSYFCCINDFGVVAGRLGGAVVVFDPLNTPSYEPIEVANGQIAYLREINNSGVIVTGGALGYPEGQVIEPDGFGNYIVHHFDDHAFGGINDFGIITGHRQGIHNGPPSNRRDGGPIRFGPPYDQEPELLVSGSADNWHSDVNNHGDICFRNNGRGFLYLDGEGVFALDALVVFDSPQDEVEWMAGSIFPTGINVNRQIIGSGNGKGFILTPMTNDPSPGITVMPTSGLITTESGGTDSFDVVLDAQPSDDVTIDISSSDTTEGTVDVSSQTFTPNSWNMPQTVTITGVDDPNIDGNIVYTIITSAATSADPDYNALDSDDVGVTNQDDEQAPTTTYNSTDTPLAIPDNSPAGVGSNIIVTDDFFIADLTVSLDISHQRPSDLDVYLIGPDNSQVQLFTFSGDTNVPNFNDNSIAGLWTVEVYDTKKKKTGTLNSWAMTVEY